jgi:hypothetical protein
LPSEEIFDDFTMLSEKEKDIVCRCFFHGVNWLIEVINTFARVKEMRSKVLQRLRDVVELKEKFFRCLAMNPTFLPPPSVFFGEPIRSRVPPTAGAKKKVATEKKAKKGKGKKGGKKANVDATSVDSPNKVTPLDSSYHQPVC